MSTQQAAKQGETTNYGSAAAIQAAVGESPGPQHRAKGRERLRRNSRAAYQGAGERAKVSQSACTKQQKIAMRQKNSRKAHKSGRRQRPLRLGLRVKVDVHDSGNVIARSAPIIATGSDDMAPVAELPRQNAPRKQRKCEKSVLELIISSVVLSFSPKIAIVSTRGHRVLPV